MKNSEDSLLRKALRFMESYSGKTENIARDPEEIDHLVGQSQRKMHSINHRKHSFKNFIPQLLTLQRMLRAYSRRDYPHLPWRALLAIVGSILYFVNPLDIIPDFIPGIGLLDDITVLAWAYKSLGSDIERFEDWEFRHRTAR